jgi:hypothetical protein
MNSLFNASERSGVLERIVENWLIKSGERGYQTPFAQLLATEGYRVLNGPVHHPYEHGKDILAMDPQARLCAFQLKGGQTIDLKEFESMQGQLMALAATAVSYPGVEPARRPDRVALVCNGVLSPPALDRLDKLNAGNREFGAPPIACIQKDELVSRFVAAHGRFLPSQPQDLSAFLRLSLADGRGPFPRQELAGFLRGLLHDLPDHGRNLAISRLLASAVLLTAYTTEGWIRKENHLGVAEGYLTTAMLALNLASEFDLPEEYWKESFDLAFAEGRARLAQLLSEAADGEDLLIPDLVEGAVYGSRVVWILGFLSALYLAERVEGGHRSLEGPLKKILLRELQYVRVSGEVAGPYLVTIATALWVLGESQEALTVVTRYAKELAAVNQPGSPEAIPDPYHSFQEVLLHSLVEGAQIEDEKFESNVYTLVPCIDWLARRHARPIVEQLWPPATRVSHLEFEVSKPSRLLTFEDEDGVLRMVHLPASGSWKVVAEDAAELLESVLPQPLWRQAAFIPFLGLLIPPRFTRSVGKALDWLTCSNVTVRLDVNDPAGPRS